MLGIARARRFDEGARAALGSLVLGGAAVSFIASAHAGDAVEAFYKGRTIEMYVGTPAGGGYDLYGRLLADHIGRHIPGNPSVIVRNMPGAAHKTMMNFVYNQAPRDGTVLAIPQQVMAVDQAMGSDGIRYDAGKFNWVGRAVSVYTVTMTWHTSPTKTIKDARKRETVMGTTGASSPTNLYLKALNELAGTKFKRVSGYAGTGETDLAMQRGEVEGVISDWSSLKVRSADWIRDKKINLLVQWGADRSPDMPEVPLVRDVGVSEAQKDVLQFFALGNSLGRAFMTTPDVPPERLEALRTAFLETMKDPALLEIAAREKIDIGPLASGGEIQKLVAQTLGYSADVIALAKKVEQQN